MESLICPPTTPAPFGVAAPDPAGLISFASLDVPAAGLDEVDGSGEVPSDARAFAVGLTALASGLSSSSLSSFSRRFFAGGFREEEEAFGALVDELGRAATLSSGRSERGDVDARFIACSPWDLEEFRARSSRLESSSTTKMSQDDTAAADKAARKAARAAKRARKEAKRLASTSAQPQLDEEESATATTNDQTEQERPKKKRKREADDYLSENAITFEPADASFTFPPILAFTDLDVPSSLTAALAAFDKPTPVQAASWPVLLAGRDAIAIAKTGSGKTLAFGLPALRHVLELPKPKHKAKEGKPPPKGAVNVLVVAPTRELAMQIHVTLDGLAAVQEPPLPTVCIYGGVSKAAQVDQLRTGKHGARIVAGTPGRLLDLANDGQLDLSNVSYLVLDEADRMLDAGFEQDVRRIVGMCKPDRQTAMCAFSAPLVPGDQH